jgi:hypothetical protein
VNLDTLVRALDATRAGGHAIAAWSIYAAEVERASLGTKDRETGAPHAPLTLSETFSARYR